MEEIKKIPQLKEGEALLTKDLLVEIIEEQENIERDE